MNELTARQYRAIETLLTARSITDAAKAANVSRRSLTSWLADAQFCAELRKATTAALDTTTRRLTSLSAKAVSTLDNSMDSEKPEVQVRAADIVLSKLLALGELHDMAARIAALEAVQQGAAK